MTTAIGGIWTKTEGRKGEEPPSRGPTVSERPRVLTALVVIVISLVWVVLSRDLLAEQWNTAVALSLLVSIEVIVLGMWVFHDPRLNSVMAFLLLYLAFNFGLVFTDALGVPGARGNAGSSYWLGSHVGSVALVTASIGLASLLAGALSLEALRGEHPRDLHHTSREVTGSTSSRATAVGIVSLALVLGGIIWWIYFIFVTLGVSPLQLSYRDFILATSGSSLSITTLFIGIGMGLLAGAPSRARRVGLIAFTVAFAIPALALGARTPVLYPALAYLVASAKVRHLSRSWLVLPGAIALLSFIAVVRQIRLSGLGSTNASALDLSPWSGLMELGGSLTTLVLVERWHDIYHEPFVGWGTYWAPFERLLVGRIMGTPVPDISFDSRVFKTAILTRASGLGGSIVGEAYWVSGIVGVIVVLALVGLVLRTLDRLPNDPIGVAATGSACSVIFVWVRGDFTPIVLNAICVALALLVSVVLARRLERRDGNTPRTSRGARTSPNPRMLAESSHHAKDSGQVVTPRN